MLRTIEIIKEQIKAIQYDQQGEKKSEVQELRELVEFINYDREILSAENQRLTKIIEENPWEAKCKILEEELKVEKRKGTDLLKKLEELEEAIAGLSFNKSCIEECYTDRSGSISRREEKSVDYMSSSYTDRKNIMHTTSLGSCSPLKPPRAIDRSSKASRIPSKAAVEIKSNLAKAIDQAHKTLFYTIQSKNRSISPCISSASSRFSTPPKKLNLNSSLMLNN